MTRRTRLTKRSVLDDPQRPVPAPSPGKERPAHFPTPEELDAAQEKLDDEITDERFVPDPNPGLDGFK